MCLFILASCSTPKAYLNPETKINRVYVETSDWLSFNQKIDNELKELRSLVKPSINDVTYVMDTGLDLHKSLVDQGGKLKRTSTPYGVVFDDNGHGTHVTGIIRKISPTTNVISDKVLINGSGTMDGIIDGLSVGIKSGANRINMSLGVSNLNDHLIQRLKDLAIEANKNEVIISIAAGNEASQSFNSLGEMPNVVVVGAVDYNENPAWFTSESPYVNTSAYGVDILSTGLNNQYLRMSGTSMSTPFVSGIDALLHQCGVSYKDRCLLLKTMSRDLPPEGWDNRTGFGIVDIPYLVNYVKELNASDDCQDQKENLKVIRDQLNKIINNE